ncbi:MAG: DUF4012 domain-containing protein [Candidatus Moraniibacteriota bacterium]
MSKKITTKTLIIFWVIAIPLLAGWYVFLQWKNDPLKMVDVAYNTSRILPLGDKYETALEIAHYVLQKDDAERNFMILLQNNMELRPGGGYIGSFATVKVKNGEVLESGVHDTANFDGRIPDTIKPPFPMESTMGIPSWKFRDSNWMPDFPTNARIAEKFYKLGKGGDDFDGVIAVNASLLDVMLDATGPIKLDNYPDTYKSGDAIMTLEYQVEQGYKDQNIEIGDRKVVMDDLSKEMIRRVKKMSIKEKISLVNNFLDSFKNKDIQLYFDDEKMNKLIDAVEWSGKVDTEWNKDYLMIVDANLASYKTDHVMNRSIDYDIDLSGTIPQAVVTVHYENTATQKDWKTSDYQTYVRIYTPADTWFTGIEGCVLEPKYGDKFAKKYVGCLVHVPLGGQKDVTVRYNLPIDMKNKYPYDLKIQKQSGVHDVPVQVHVKNPGMESTEDYSFYMDTDITLSELK